MNKEWINDEWQGEVKYGEERMKNKEAGHFWVMTSSDFLCPTSLSSWAPGQFYFLHPASDTWLVVTQTLCNSNFPLTWSNFHFPSDHLIYQIGGGWGVLLFLFSYYYIWLLGEDINWEIVPSPAPVVTFISFHFILLCFPLSNLFYIFMYILTDSIR